MRVCTSSARLRHVFMLVVLVAAGLLPGAATAFEPGARRDIVNVQILAANDIHGQVTTGRTISGRPVGGLAYLDAYMDMQEAGFDGTTIRAEIGDSAGASPPVSALLQDEPTIAIMNEMGFDIGVLGNHEFDEGRAELERLIEGGCHPVTEPLTGCFAGTGWPRLAANVVDRATGQPILPPFKVIRAGGVRIGFIGVVTTETPDIVIAGATKGLVFRDEASTINRYVNVLKRRGIETIVVLAHEGGELDGTTGRLTGPIADIAHAIDDEVDAIASGHFHTGFVATVDGKLITQAYSYTTGLADIRLAIDKQTGEVVFKRANILTTWNNANIAPDPTISALVGTYTALVGPLINEVVGTAAGDITRMQSPAGESALGNLIADAQRWQTGVDVAFLNPGGIRADIAAGDVTWGELFAVQPFGNNLVTLDLTGAQIATLLNQQWQAGGTRFLQMSGLEYTWDASRPAGDRIVEARIAGGKLLNPSATYRVVANAFLAAGGDGFSVMAAGSNRKNDVPELDALVDYIRQLAQPFDARIEGRIETTGGPS
jgi:5'-nucleotidase